MQKSAFTKNSRLLHIFKLFSLVPHYDTTEKNCTRKTNPFDVAAKQK